MLVSTMQHHSITLGIPLSVSIGWQQNLVPFLRLPFFVVVVFFLKPESLLISIETTNHEDQCFSFPPSDLLPLCPFVPFLSLSPLPQLFIFFLCGSISGGYFYRLKGNQGEGGTARTMGKGRGKFPPETKKTA